MENLVNAVVPCIPNLNYYMEPVGDNDLDDQGQRW